MCFITYKNYTTTFLAFNGNTTKKITQTPNSGVMAFCNNFRSERLKNPTNTRFRSIY